MGNDMHTTIGIFYKMEEAENAVQELLAHGFSNDDLGFVTPDANRRQTQPAVTTLEGAATSSSHLSDQLRTGATLGGLGGLVFGELVIPGVGWFAAAGTIASMLAGAGLGAIAGGMTAAMETLGVPKDQSARYAEAIQNGRTLVSVHSSAEQVPQVIAVLRRHHAADPDARPDGAETRD
jgi:hypothetical protein